MDIEYETLSITEIRRLASEGDTKARQLLDEMWAEFRAAMESAPPNSLGGFLNDVSRFRSGDMEAGMRLSKTWYSKGRIFAPQRWEVLRDYVKQKRDVDKSRDVWWNIETVTSALALIVYPPEILEFPITDVYRLTRNNVRPVIEKDLTGGYTSDSKEFENTSPSDVPGGDPDEQEEQGEKMIFDARDAAEKYLDLRLALAEFSQEKYRLLTAVSYGDLKSLAQELGKTAGAIRAAKTRAKKELKDRLNSV